MENRDEDRNGSTSYWDSGRSNNDDEKPLLEIDTSFKHSKTLKPNNNNMMAEGKTAN